MQYLLESSDENILAVRKRQRTGRAGWRSNVPELLVAINASRRGQLVLLTRMISGRESTGV
jgi:hypothetical protein